MTTEDHKDLLMGWPDASTLSKGIELRTELRPEIENMIMMALERRTLEKLVKTEGGGNI